MKTPGHLVLQQVQLAPGQEWTDQAPAWRFASVRRGSGYWLDPLRPRALNEGELVVTAPGVKALIRASQLGPVELQTFSFAPDMLCGFFTLTERHFLETHQAGSEPVEFLPSTHPLTHNFAEIVEQQIAAPAPATRLGVLGIVVDFFSHGMARHNPAPAHSLSAHQRFQKIISQMPDLELINYTPEQLAALCGCSPRHFNRLFHAQFGDSPRACQTELRLLKARQLLSDTDTKVIQVALESGYRSLSLFNALFKRRFGTSPSGWRRKFRKTNGKACVLLAFIMALASLSLRTAMADPEPGSAMNDRWPFDALGTNTVPQLKAAEALHRKIAELQALEQSTNSSARKHLTGASNIPRPPLPPITATNGPTFAVRGYELLGNTVLPKDVTDPILERYTGPVVNFPMIRQAVQELQMAYRDRGYATVAVGLPQQQLTNGIVKVQVTEGRLVEVNVINNRYYTSNNVMRELPSLKTNMLLNALVFQQELDRANANKDRQIYPVLQPGPDPGTTILDLKVKDRLPLHAHVDLNNYSTPNTPVLRADLAISYANLWQLDHQVGFQYSFSPESYKAGSYPFYDQPLIANYSAYYRLPLQGANGGARQSDYQLTDFGYDEATRRFRPPPPSGASELVFYASRSSSDTGNILQSETLSPDPLPPGGGLQTRNQIYTQTINPNEDLGARFSKPLPDFLRLVSSVSGGLDFKNYRSLLTQTRIGSGTIYTPIQGQTNGPPWDPPDGTPAPIALSSQRTVFTSVQYLPFNLSWQGSVHDATGVTSLSLGNNFNFGGLLSRSKDFQAATGSSRASGNYYALTAGLGREQKIVGDWGVRLHADGQWANEPLISNEQFALGGQAGPRGYRDGTEYGDRGWRVQLEPHSPYWNMGLAFDRAPIVTRTFAFVDYGERYLIDPGARAASVDMLGVGAGLDLSIGEHFDCHVTMGVPLLNTPLQERGHPRVAFSLGVQW